MTDEIINPGDISLSNRQILLQYWEDFYSQDKTPGEFFNYLNEKNPEIYMDFNEKLQTQCRNTLKSGYKQWAYRKYRYDHHGEEGVLVLYSEVTNYLLKSSEREQFLNLKEVFKNGITYINRNLNSTIKRVLAETREKTVIDRLLRRIEQIADDNSNEITRTRIEKYGEKADFFTLIGKIPEERSPTNYEIEKAISLVGNFKESPQKINAKQASRIYTTEQLLDMMIIICRTLPTDVTPNTLETIFIDLIPDFLPDEFLIEQAFKIYGHVNFPVDTEKKLTFGDLDQADQLIVDESVRQCIEEINQLGINKECEVIKKYVEKKDLKVNKLVNETIFTSREHVEEILEKIGGLTNKIFSSFEDEKVSEIAFSLLFEKL